MTRGCQPAIDHEPATIDATAVARVLERHGMPRMAAWVKDIGQTLQRNATVTEMYRTQMLQFHARLQAYEPDAVRHEPHCPVPPPESSD